MSGISVHGKLWLAKDGEALGGADRIALLASVAEHGSITKAAKAVGMSYKGAWDAIDAMNTLAGEALVQRVAGGKGGGGTRLTPRGAQLVRNFREVEAAHRRFIDDLRLESHALPDAPGARNRLPGTVRAVRRSAANDEVILDIAGGQQIVAVITHDSTDSLGLAPGVAAFALVRPSDIIIAVGEGGRTSARNQLRGVIDAAQAGEVNTALRIALPGGGTLAATVTRESGEALALRPGAQVTALFKASSVILGLLSL